MAFSEVTTCKASRIKSRFQVVIRVTVKSCRRICQFFRPLLDTVPHEKITWCPDQNCQSPEEKTTQGTTQEVQSTPSTILIVNINNSTLTDCVIGKDIFSHVVRESQPLMQHSDHQIHDQLRCSCCRDQQGTAQNVLPPLPPSIGSTSVNILSSSLNCAIIGDNNYMYTEQTHTGEIDETQM